MGLEMVLKAFGSQNGGKKLAEIHGKLAEIHGKLAEIPVHRFSRKFHTLKVSVLSLDW